MKTLMRNQIQEALKHKWLKGVEKGCDPGPEAVNEWIDRYAATYRKDYDDCFSALVAATLERSYPRLRKIHPDLNKDAMAEMARVVLEEFTSIWFLEISKPDHNHHVEEI